MRTRHTLRAVLLLFTVSISSMPIPAEQVPVRHQEGRIHGFLVLRDTEDRILASGELTQSVTGNRVTAALSFRFKDGSVHEETSVFSQQKLFRLLTYRQVQKGPAFKRSTDMSVNTSTGKVTIRYTDDDGKEQNVTETMKLPPDLANGIVPTLLADIDTKVAKTTLSMVVSTPKPRLVKLEISPGGDDSFSVGGAGWKAVRHVVKVEIGGIAGVIAPLVGKQPPDTHVWMAVGKVPGFLKSEGPMFQDGPIWKVELASPIWPKGEAGEKK